MFALATLIATCAFALGALLGFLFGVPQYFARDSQAPVDPARARYQPNTNLTQVSDWLTKIIIGVGLVEFGQLTEAIGEMGDSLEPSFGGSSSGRAFAIALVVGFFVIGFLVGYLYTRLRLQWAFATADRAAFEDVAKREIAQQNEVDAKALKLVSRTLDPAAEKPPPADLKAALDEASPAVKEQALMQARGEKTSSQPPSDRAQVVLEAIDEVNRGQS
jgi:hypothetical protein